MTGWRLTAAVVVVTFAVTPLAFLWWLLRSVGHAIERVNGGIG